MPFPTESPQEWVDHLVAIGAYVRGCKTCEEAIEYVLKNNSMPMQAPHKTKCENKYDHCTCDRCF